MSGTKLTPRRTATAHRCRPRFPRTRVWLGERPAAGELLVVRIGGQEPDLGH